MLTRRSLSVIVALLVATACGHASSAAEPSRLVCKLTPLNVGVCQIGKDHVLGKGYAPGERMPFVIYSFLVEGPQGETALVDLGPKSLDYVNGMFRQYGFFRDLGSDVPAAKRYPDDITQPDGNVLRQLARRKIAPESIGHVVFTHLHADHHGMHDARDGGVAEELPRAMLHVSQKGWQDNLAKRRDGRWNSYVDYAFSDFLLRREKQKIGPARFADNAQVMPGVWTVYLGGHSPCSQAVVIETAEGPAIITSDEIYLFQLLEENILPAIRTSEKNYRAAIQRLVKLARDEKGILIPLHDPIVWETYQKHGDRWLAAMRKHSDRAIAAYERTRDEQ